MTESFNAPRWSGAHAEEGCAVLFARAGVKPFVLRTGHVLPHFVSLPARAAVVNSARVALESGAASCAALDRGLVAVAGLRCFRAEPTGNPVVAQYDSVFMLPGIGSVTRKTCDAVGFGALDNLDAFFAGRTPGDLL